ncbi:hypothetical protein [Tranquillimonas alkanivorans]|uniref:DUF4177 domain-containing protein n=1 Tax=Tranquillimonas alkanivorans TaxID=441119 RepID=A0A1I5L3X7_9RHOB|nr:hypothetical protein [Tranquillimonas alkanivorans]SFO91893.1 hypothetical protein SAMN04488047_101448 [Tranquillimonas alkanivorans]
MRRLLFPLTLALMMIAVAASADAACYADYKAKRDDPLRLHYGVIALPEDACGDAERAAAVIAERLAGEGWTLLSVDSTFGAEGLEERKDDAAEFYLRY